MAKCTYCKGEITDGRVVEVCDRCGVKVWGAKMFKAIQDGMNSEKEKGNMELGRVGEAKPNEYLETVKEVSRR